MYISKLNKYKNIYWALCLIYSVFIVMCWNLKMDLTKLWFIFSFFTILYIFLTSHIILFRQDKYIENHNKELYKKYSNTWIRPIAISVRLLLSPIGTKSDYNEHCVDLIINETKKAISFYIKLIIILIIAFFVNLVRVIYMEY